MKQPLKEKLSEKLYEKGMKVDIQSARLSKLVPTTDTPEEIRNGATAKKGIKLIKIFL